ncbi:hypothetical protein P3T76_015357 [Phytophthora citrophthora]|uniref:Uncharacterized protein n=1 Tax=Phytophthora citrophthora TaxID=4793 RepID=A0AAD9LBJ7_9STRA|nr:hypothetical protein P3T76_015357 [Phytophthora citrophthora]
MVKQLQNSSYKVATTVPAFDPTEAVGGYDRFKPKGLPTVYGSARLDPKLLVPHFKKLKSKPGSSPKTHPSNISVAPDASGTASPFGVQRRITAKVQVRKHFAGDDQGQRLNAFYDRFSRQGQVQAPVIAQVDVAFVT